MLFDSIADNVRLLESLTLFSSSNASAAAGSPEHYFLSCEFPPTSLHAAQLAYLH
jgi:hypothetical protein